MKILIALAGVVALVALAGCGDDSTTPTTTASVPTVTGPTDTGPTGPTKKAEPNKAPQPTISSSFVDSAGRQSQCREQVIPPGSRQEDQPAARIAKAIAECMNVFPNSKRMVAFCVESVSNLSDDAKVDPGWNFGFCLGQFYKFANRVQVCTQAAPAYSKPSTRAHLIARCAEGFRVMHVSLQENSKTVG